MKLYIHLVTWNGGKYIPYLFDSLKNQTFKDFKLVILDNGSTDNTVEELKLKIKDLDIECELIENKENKGFAGGHNQLSKNSKLRTPNSELILLLNQDLYLAPDCIEKMIKFIDRHDDVVALAPRTMKWNHEFLVTNPHESVEKSFTNIIDSLGLKIYRNRRVVEIGEGVEYHDKQQQSDYVFGVSGAIALFRRNAINEIGFLDESFGSYKEDVDLAYRINIAGWKSAVLYGAITYHDRGGAGVKNKSDLASFKNKQHQRPWVRYHSYKNHLMTLIKNEYWQNLALDFPFVLWYELKKFGYFLLFDRKVLSGLGEIWRSRKDLKIKRLMIKELRKIGWREMRQWWKNT